MYRLGAFGDVTNLVKQAVEYIVFADILMPRLIGNALAKERREHDVFTFNLARFSLNAVGCRCIGKTKVCSLSNILATINVTRTFALTLLVLKGIFC